MFTGCPSRAAARSNACADRGGSLGIATTSSSVSARNRFTDPYSLEQTGTPRRAEAGDVVEHRLVIFLARSWR